jgi:hypothetical protein
MARMRERRIDFMGTSLKDKGRRMKGEGERG